MQAYSIKPSLDIGLDNWKHGLIDLRSLRAKAGFSCNRAACALKHCPNPPRPLANDPRGLAVFLARRDPDQSAVNSCVFSAFAFARVNAP